MGVEFSKLQRGFQSLEVILLPKKLRYFFLQGAIHTNAVLKAVTG